MNDESATAIDTNDEQAAERAARLALNLVPGVGPRTYRLLLERFGSAREAIQASRVELLSIRGIGPQLAEAIHANATHATAQAEYGRCRQHGIRLMFEEDGEYPSQLREIPDPPPVLYCRGNLQPCDGLSIAIVGTRHATQYGRRQAEVFAGGLARAGCTIVSGLARGIDGVAHRAALTSGGRTIAILAGGVAEIYPPEHKELAETITQSGALLSEFHSTSQVRSGIFPRRNRVISGMSLAVLVVEAGLRSGALSTARHAVEQNRDVFALPGPVDSRVSQGCHSLLKQGALLVESVEDILDALGPLANIVMTENHGAIRRPGELKLNPQEMQLLQSIDPEPTSIDQLIARTGLPAARVLSTISVLEMRRLIRRLSGQLVCRS